MQAKILGVIPVRIGSKGIPKKNLQPLNLKTLTSHAVETALASKLDAVVLSADDESLFVEGFEASLDKGVLIRNRRPYVSDTQSSEEAVCEVYDSHPEFKDVFPHAMLIQATSPGVTKHDIDRAIDVYDCENPVISIAPALGFYYRVSRRMCGTPILDPLHPHGTRMIGENGKPRRLFRNEYESLYTENGAFYLAPLRNWELNDRLLGVPRGIVMDHWRSHEIDEPMDLESWRRCYDIWVQK